MTDTTDPKGESNLNPLKSFTDPIAQLRDQLTEIMYGAGWRDDPIIVDAYKPDVEAAMRLFQEAMLEARIDEFSHVVYLSAEGYYRAVKLPNGDTEFTPAKERLAELRAKLNQGDHFRDLT